MQKTYTIFVGLLICLINESAQTQINTFERTYHYQNFDIGKAIIAHPDGGYAVLGFSMYGNSQKDSHFYFMRINEQGDILMSRVWGETDKIDIAQDFVMTSDGGYMVVGSSSSNIYIGRLDAEGFPLWEQRIDEDMICSLHSICKAGNEEYLIVGFAEKFNERISDVLFIRIDESGSISVKKNIYARGNCYSIKPGHKDDFFLVGSTDSFTAPDILLMRTDRDGNVLWQKTIIESQNLEAAIACCETSDNGFAVTGFWSSQATSMDAFTVKVDSSNTIEWCRTYPISNFESMVDIKSTRDGGFILAGESSEGKFPNDAYLMKLDANGDIEWTRTMGSSVNDWATAVLQAKDGGYIFVGCFGDSSSEESGDIYVVKTNEIGLVTNVNTLAADIEPEHFLLFPNFPNPFNPVTTIQFYLPTAFNIHVSVVNASGQLVEVLKQGYVQAGLQTLQWNASDHASGVYYLVVRAREYKKVRVMSLVK